MAELIVFKQYSDRMLAEVDRSLFESEGIMALITSDDEGGLAPHLALINGVKLLINDTDAEKAKELLKNLES